MARAELHPQRERNHQHSWQRMKSPIGIGGERTPVVTEILTWNPNVMPSNLEINPDHINAFIRRLSLPYSIVEIQRLDQKPSAAPTVSSVDHSGRAVASATAIAVEPDASRSLKDHKADIKIDFDKLLAEASRQAHSATEQRRLFAQLVENAFRSEVTMMTLETIKKRLEVDFVNLVAVSIALISSVTVFELGDKNLDAVKLSIALFSGFTVMYKSIASLAHFMYRFKNDEEFRNQLFYKAAKRHDSGSPKRLDQLQRQEMDFAMIESLVALPLYQNGRTSLNLLLAEVSHQLDGPSLFRPAN